MPLPDLTTFVLVLARIAGLVHGAPILGHLAVPQRVRAGLTLALALALTPAVPPAAAPASLWALGGAVVVEAALGTLLGLVAQFIFAGVQLGGQLAGMQMGFGLVNLIDPQSNAHVTVIAEWQQLIALLVFLALDVHHVLLRALVESFHTAPPGAVALSAIGIQGAIALSGELFALGVRIAAPVMIALLMSNGALGVLARTIPQLNVFVVGFPVHVGVGLVVLGASLPFTFRLLTVRFAALEPILGGLVHGLAHG